MFEKKLEAGRHILTGKPIPLMRDGRRSAVGMPAGPGLGGIAAPARKGCSSIPATVWGMGMAFLTASGYTVGATTGEGV